LPLAGFCCSPLLDEAAGQLEGHVEHMTATAPTQRVRFTRAGIAGLTVGAACVWRTGLLSAFPSAFGLTMLAALDYSSRRVPRDVFAASAAATLALGVLDSAVRTNDNRLLAASLITAIVALVAGAIWAATSGIAFGDVKLLALAAFVPAWLRGSAVLTMVLVALVAAVGMVVVERLRAGALTMKSSIAFGPPLLIGWLVGVLTA
jgi:leader peptidase (prepilin peptidase) / N-methyltransferase